MFYEELQDKSGIYLIYNILTQQVYIGQTEKIKTRIRKHRESLIKGKHKNPKLQNSFNVYGLSAFDVVVLCICTIDQLDEYEQTWLDLLKLEYPKENIYNLCFEPNTTRGYRFTDQQRKEQSERLKVKKVTDASRESYRTMTKERWKNGIMKPRPRKEFDIINPNGELIHVVGLSEFAENNNLSAGSLHQLLTGKLKQYKGFVKP